MFFSNHRVTCKSLTLPSVRLFPSGWPSEDLHIPQLQTDLHRHPHHRRQHGHHGDLRYGSSPRQSEWAGSTKAPESIWRWTLFPPLAASSSIWSPRERMVSTAMRGRCDCSLICITFGIFNPVSGGFFVTQLTEGLSPCLVLFCLSSTLCSRPFTNTTQWRTGRTLLLITQIAWR